MESLRNNTLTEDYLINKMKQYGFDKKISENHFVNSLAFWQIMRLSNKYETKWVAIHNEKAIYARYSYFEIFALIKKNSKPTKSAEIFYKSATKKEK
jgi:hypothetical protein